MNAARVWLVAALATAAAAGRAEPAGAQVTSSSPKYDLGFGGMFVGRTATDDTPANLTRSDGGSLPLFNADVRLDQGLGLEAHVGRRLGSRWGIEVTGSWVRAQVRAAVSRDFEGVPATTQTDDLTRFALEGSALFRVAGGPRRFLFIRGGAGWMREVAGAGTLSADGLIANAGVGMKYWWGHPGAGSGRSWGLRLDGRAVLRQPGIDLGPDAIRVAPAASANILFGF